MQFSIEPDGYFLPEYPVPDGQDFDTHLKSLVEESLDKLIAKFDNDKVEEYKTRVKYELDQICLLYTSPSPRDLSTSRMPSSA